ncbi:MAG: hypothetical protein M1838_004243 [Thelocarpon superellum]|nr:MAG: hypothetical protein M1838_004243 [Thelocarpon superellum]
MGLVPSLWRIRASLPTALSWAFLCGAQVVMAQETFNTLPGGTSVLVLTGLTGAPMALSPITVGGGPGTAVAPLTLSTGTPSPVPATLVPPTTVPTSSGTPTPAPAPIAPAPIAPIPPVLASPAPAPAPSPPAPPPPPPAAPAPPTTVVTAAPESLTTVVTETPGSLTTVVTEPLGAPATVVTEAPGVPTTVVTVAPGPPGPSPLANDPAVANFGDTIEVLGQVRVIRPRQTWSDIDAVQMERTDQHFQDGLALDLLSPSNRTLVVTQNNSPLAASFVTGSSGEPWVAVHPYSYIVQMSEPAYDLIAKIELPYDPSALAQMGVDPSNTYVGKLSDDRTSWVVSEPQRNVHISEQKAQIVKMTSLDGEYLLLGRKTQDTSNIFMQYGFGDARTVNVIGGPGRQDSEFIDGLRLSITSANTFTFNVDLEYGVDAASLPPGVQSLNSFAWKINSTATNGEVQAAEIRFPFNRMMLSNMLPGGASPTTQLVVARRDRDSTGVYQPLEPDNQFVLELTEDRIRIPSITELDGQYVIFVTPSRVLTSPIGAIPQQPVPLGASISPGYRRRRRGLGRS